MTASVLSRALAITLLAASCCAQTENTAYEGVPFEMPRIQLPSIPQRSVCLTDFDAAGDGVTLNTEAFAKAIDQLARQGGGVTAVGMGSKLFPKEVIAAGDWASISALCTKCLNWFKK